MLLLIDAGNTRIKWALAETGSAPGDWLASGAAVHAELAQLAPAWSRALAGGTLSRVLVSNVAGPAMRTRLEQLLRGYPQQGSVGWFASLPRLAGVRNGYRNPAQLGCDRFAAAIGAHALAPGQPVIVANCGTATTIDAVSADGHFVGGMILPGLQLMASSLARNTAQLPQIAYQAALPTGFADNTDDAILSGCLAAQAGAIERAVAAHNAGACILSGGAAPHIAAALTVAHRLVDNIVMIGLHAATVDGGGVC
ncbi:type III pantothenate kinase [Janthinobacterium agaricidamnosum]|uniref:Type III pantothenate kinase n=1 Tax=Janthinobacterium agaricidamnosum NBRC 102515 = DSM 9628 TaxID=1349767 RepID=W0VD00_9BURK|nr:type III pantothenate kinase [Janthinobacterium agaricidamnosum]CDG85253.1 transcriptional activator, Baf family protein [Janthinobacterium agaricidamnosum NBRC 102515 = DSM 9628]